MPQGPSNLHEKWGDDGAALNALRSVGLRPNRGGVFIIPADVILSAESMSALSYLVQEWDYDWKYSDDGQG